MLPMASSTYISSHITTTIAPAINITFYFTTMTSNNNSNSKFFTLLPPSSPAIILYPSQVTTIPLYFLFVQHPFPPPPSLLPYSTFSPLPRHHVIPQNSLFSNLYIIGQYFTFHPYVSHPNIVCHQPTFHPPLQICSTPIPPNDSHLFSAIFPPFYYHTITTTIL